MKNSKKTSKTRIVKSSGNVFADLGLSNPQERLAKAELAAAIYAHLRKRGLTQSQTAKILGIKQPRVSALVTGQLELFSTDALIQYLTALGSDVRISISDPHRNQRGKVHVMYPFGSRKLHARKPAI